MKILFIDISIKGHRLGYLRALANCVNDFVLLLPDDTANIGLPYIPIKSGFDKKRSLKNYLRFVKEIQDLIRSKEITAVHFLCGDALYKFFGFGLRSLDVPTLVTFHHMVFKMVKAISIKRIFKNIDFGIIHTSHLFTELLNRDIKNAVHIEYPVFNKIIDTTIEDSRAYFNLPNSKETPIISVMGGTQYYKGLDILLKALKLVNENFLLFICGPERKFTKDYIEEETNSFKNKVVTNLKFLTDTEFANAINASDIIVLPYRYEFDGASGPLAESVIYRKYIIGSSHGSLGRLIIDNQLGCTFKTEDSIDLAKKLNWILQSDRKWSLKAEEYRMSLKVDYFCSAYRKLYK